MSSLRGRLLVAAPPLTDPNFDRTVVFVVEHGPEGAIGVVINRPTYVPVKEILPLWAERAAEPAVMFTGGPVGKGSVIAVGRPTSNTADLGAVIDDVVLVDLEQDPLDVEVEDVRLFHSHAGWSADQLETEIEVGGWLVVDATPDDLRTDEPEDLWRRVLRRQGGRMAVLSFHPPDLHAN